MNGKIDMTKPLKVMIPPHLRGPLHEMAYRRQLRGVAPLIVELLEEATRDDSADGHGDRANGE